MKHTVLRLLCLLLCAVMVLGMVPATAAAATTQLGAPSDITWSPIMPGGVWWTVNRPVETPVAHYQVDLYKDGSKVYTENVNGDVSNLDYYNLFDCNFDEYNLTTGDYYVTVKAVATKEGFTDSETVKSDVWHYTHPGIRYSRPTNLTWNYPEVSWDSNYSSANYQVQFFYSATKDGTPEQIPFGLVSDQTSNDISEFRYFEYGGEGYYFFRVRTYSYNITTKYHSAWTDLSEPYYYTENPTELKITTQPASVWVAEGDKATVTVEAEGDGLTYAWYYKNPGDSSYTYTSSFTGDTYSVTMNEDRDGRYVYCKVSDQYGNTVKSKTVSLNMQTPLKITTQPKSVKVAEGKTAKVTVKAQGDGLTYRWYYKNPGATSYSYTSSFTGNSYSVTMNEDRDGRYVYCRIYDKWGNSVKTNTVSLRMK